MVKLNSQSASISIHFFEILFISSLFIGLFFGGKKIEIYALNKNLRDEKQ